MPKITRVDKTLTKTFTDNDSATISLISVDNESRRRSEANRVFNAIFDPTVQNFDAVYWDSTSHVYNLAIADGSDRKRTIGIANIDRKEVITQGVVDDFPGFSEGDILYLSKTNAGKLVNSMPDETPVKFGEIVWDVNKQKLILMVDIYNYVNVTNSDMIDGYHAGHSTAQIPISDGTNNTDLNADMVDGYHAGNLTGQIPVNNGTLNQNLNADLLDGYHAGHSSGNVPISDGTSNTNLNADMIDGYHSGHSSGQIPISDGTNNTNLNADMLDGYHLNLSSSSQTVPLRDSNSAIHASAYVSDVATGNPPLVVTSTTLNTNLNADMLDGHHSTRDWGSVGVNTTMDLSTAQMHVISFSADASCIISFTNSVDRALLIIKNNNHTVTLVGVDNNSPTLTKAVTTQDMLAVVKSFGKITCVSYSLGIVTS